MTGMAATEQWPTVRPTSLRTSRNRRYGWLMPIFSHHSRRADMDDLHPGMLRSARGLLFISVIRTWPNSGHERPADGLCADRTGVGDTLGPIHQSRERR